MEDFDIYDTALEAVIDWYEFIIDMERPNFQWEVLEKIPMVGSSLLHPYLTKTDYSHYFQATFRESIAEGHRPDIVDWTPYDAEIEVLEKEIQLYK